VVEVGERVNSFRGVTVGVAVGRVII